MKLGTKTLLFGVHQFLIHPLLVILAWMILYNSLPNLKELICIFIHDIGYWGLPSLKCAEGDKHPERGAKLAEKWFGTEYHDFILGHSTFYCKRNKIPPSKLMAADKYWHCIVPLWFYKMLAVPTGEFKHYRELKHARQVADRDKTDIEWWNELRIVCWNKVNNCHTINESILDQPKDCK